MSSYRSSIGKENAVKLAGTSWWEGKDDRDIVKFQLFTLELCMPFALFHQKLEAVLGRPVWTQEFAAGYDGICREFLGEKESPSLQEIMDLIPEDKRAVVVLK